MPRLIIRFGGLGVAAALVYGFYQLLDNYGRLLRELRLFDWAKANLDFGILRDLEIVILVVIAILSLWLVEKIGGWVAPFFEKE